MGEARKVFKAAMILTINDDSHPLDELLPRMSEGFRLFRVPSDMWDGGVEGQANSWEAAGGRAAMEMGQLSRSRKAVPSY